MASLERWQCLPVLTGDWKKIIVVKLSGQLLMAALSVLIILVLLTMVIPALHQQPHTTRGRIHVGH